MGHGSHQWSGYVEAEVTDVDDPEQKGRIKVNGRGITADGADVELDEWIPLKTTVSYGLHLPPRVGDVVGVEFTSGDTSDTAHGETFLRNPNLKIVGAIRRDSEDIDERFRKKTYNTIVGYIEQGRAAGWTIDRKDNVAMIWGTKTIIGAVGTEKSFEGVIPSFAFGYWMEDLISIVVDMHNAIYGFMTQILEWGESEEPSLPGWPVVGSPGEQRALMPQDDYLFLVQQYNLFIDAFDNFEKLPDWIGNWQHQTILIKDSEEFYEKGDVFSG